MDVQAIRAAWAEWDAASAATEAAYSAWIGTRHMPRRTKAEKAAYVERSNTRSAEWHATLDRTDAACKAVAGLPDMSEVEAHEAEQAAIAAELANQGGLF